MGCAKHSVTHSPNPGNNHSVQFCTYLNPALLPISLPESKMHRYLYPTMVGHRQILNFFLFLEIAFLIAQGYS